jgi:hypothetical protein
VVCNEDCWKGPFRQQQIKPSVKSYVLLRTSSDIFRKNNIDFSLLHSCKKHCFAFYFLS